MTQAADILEDALRCHRAGELEQARAGYLQALETEPENADAHHLLGLLFFAQGDGARAVEHLRRAVASNPESAEFRHQLGVALGTTGSRDEAIECLREALGMAPHAAGVLNDLAELLHATGHASEADAMYREAIRLAPEMAAAHNNLGNLLQDRQDWPGALDAFKTAVRLRPDVPEVHFNLGNCYLAQRLWPAAEGAYREAIARRPTMAAAHHQLGVVLEKQNRAFEAAQCQREAIRLEPEHVEAHIRLGAVLQAQGALGESEACYRRALALRPHDGTARLALGTALEAQRRVDEAVAAYEEAVCRLPDHADAHYNLARHRHIAGAFDEALAHYDRAVALAPQRADIHFYRAVTMLTRGELERAWPEFEWRLKTQYAGKTYPQPRWRGEPLDGEPIVVYAEWALGDTLQFARYVPMVAQRGGDVVFEVQPPLIPLLRESGFTQLVPLESSESPACRWQVPLLSLPGVFGTTLDSVPAPIPYLAAAPERVEAWGQRLQDCGGLRVGIHWQGSNAWGTDDRVIPLVEFARVALPGVTLISLQKNIAPGELDAVRDRMTIVDLSENLDRDGAFLDTAAVMKQLDLVISCDTAVAHLAGALGVPVWLAIPPIAEWRWLVDRDDSPWYPTMRLFRQLSRGDWGRAFDQMAVELANLIRNKST